MKNLILNFMQKTLTILCVFIFLNANAQYVVDWEKNYGGNNSDAATKILKKDDGGYLMLGSSNSNTDDFFQNGNPQNDIWLVKINQIGIIEWKKNFGGTENNVVNNITETADGGYVLAGNKGSNYSDYWVVKIDSIGNIVWENTFGGTGGDYLAKVIELSDGTYIAAGSTNSTDGDVSISYNGNNISYYDYWLVKMDANGNFLWEKSYGGSKGDLLNNIIETNNGLTLYGGSGSDDYDVSNHYGGAYDVWILKIDFLGNILWEKNYGGSGNEKVEATNSFMSSNDGGYYFTVTTKSNDYDISNTNYAGYDIWFVKIDSLGTIEWENSYGSIKNEYSTSLIQKSNGNFLIGGFEQIPAINAYLIEVDSFGQLLTTSTFGGTGSDKISDIALDNNENPVLFCETGSNDMDVSNNYGGYFDWWLVKTKPLTGTIFGKVVVDANENCIFDANEELVPQVIIEANNINVPYLNYYANTTNQGYAIIVDTVNYDVSYVAPSPYFTISSCSLDTQIAILNSLNIDDTIDFYLNPLFYCPYMEVDISAPFLRKCFDSNYYISYCNNGTQTANNAFVEIEFDPELIINSSTIPWTTIVGNTYTFPIGNIAMFDCGGFSVNVTVACDSTTFLGQVLCAEAHIFPDTICLPSSNTWNGAELQAKAECVGTDSVEFTLKNIGNGNMGGDVPIMVIEDVILIMDSFDQLDAGDEIKWKFPTNGTETFRMIAQQPSNHPFKTFTTDAVAYCNLTASAGPPPVQDTAFLAYPNDEEAPYVAIDCQPIIGSYDPNDKTVYPTGVSSEHYITEKTDLEYKIRFQNTGTDTAFTVVITDSISSLLDLTSIRPGASSHPYQFDIYGTGVLKFTFNNILLADSFVNEPASHGFVQYKIAQKEGNQVGEEILNNADIFFDFNLPVRTNTAFSKIGGIFLDTIIYNFPTETENPDGIAELEEFNITVYPNPAKNVMFFEFEEKQKAITLELFDTQGKMQHKTIANNTNTIKLNRNNLARGIYFFIIYSNETKIAVGKLVFE